MRALSYGTACLRHVVPASFVAFLAVSIPLNFWPHTRTLAFVTPPPLQWADLRAGKAGPRAESALQESSWLAVQWRSAYAQAAYRLGVLDVAKVAYGADQWLFLRESLAVDAPSFKARVADRARFLGDLRRYVERLGVTLVVAIAPDKEHIYPELIYERGQMPDARAALYGTAVAEMRSAGLLVVDLLAPLLERRQREPDLMLYFPRDTHWALDGAATAALAVKQHALDNGWGAMIGDQVPYHPSPVIELDAVGDLVVMLGFVADGRLGGLPRMPCKAFALWLHGEPLASEQPNARLALCGTSFSQVHFGVALCAATGVAIDRTGVRVGGGAFAGLLATLAAIERGELAARVVVWEFVERSLMAEWRHPPLLPR